MLALQGRPQRGPICMWSGGCHQRRRRSPQASSRPRRPASSGGGGRRSVATGGTACARASAPAMVGAQQPGSGDVHAEGCSEVLANQLACCGWMLCTSARRAARCAGRIRGSSALHGRCCCALQMGPPCRQSPHPRARPRCPSSQRPMWSCCPSRARAPLVSKQGLGQSGGPCRITGGRNRGGGVPASRAAARAYCPNKLHAGDTYRGTWHGSDVAVKCWSRGVLGMQVGGGCLPGPGLLGVRACSLGMLCAALQFHPSPAACCLSWLQCSTDPVAWAEFALAADQLASLRHPNLAQVSHQQHAWGSTGPPPAAAQQLGEKLADLHWRCTVLLLSPPRCEVCASVH